MSRAVTLLLAPNTSAGGSDAATRAALTACENGTARTRHGVARQRVRKVRP